MIQQERVRQRARQGTKRGGGVRSPELRPAAAVLQATPLDSGEKEEHGPPALPLAATTSSEGAVLSIRRPLFSCDVLVSVWGRHLDVTAAFAGKQ